MLAKVMSRSDVGKFAVALGILEILALATVFGMDQGVVRTIGENEHRGLGSAKTIVINACTSCILTAIATIAATLSLIGFLGSVMFDGHVAFVIALVIALTAALRGANLIVGSACRALDCTTTANMCSGANGGPLTSLLFLFQVWLLWYLGTINWELTILAYAIATACSLAACSWALFKTLRTATTGNERFALRRTIGFMWNVGQPLFWAQLAGIVAGRGDIVFASFFVDSPALANYEAARRLILVAGISLGITNVAAIRFINRLYSRNEIEKLERLLRGLATLAALPCVGVLAIACIWPTEILTTVYGPQYSGAASTVRMLIPGQLVFVLSGACGLVLMQIGMSRVNFRSSIASILVTGSFGFPVLLWFGIEWFALVVSAGICVRHLTNYFVLRRTTGLRTEPLGIRGFIEVLRQFSGRNKPITAASSQGGAE